MSDTSGHKFIKQGYESYPTAGWKQLLCKIYNFHTRYLKLMHHLPCICICYSTSKTNTIHKILWRINTTVIFLLHCLVSLGHYHGEHIKYKAEDI
jgi:hypothetical protein